MRGTALASLLDKKNNNFNLLRFIAASSVILSHGWLATGGETTAEPLYGPTPFTLGQHAVLVFFALSGFLVSASLDRSTTGRDFLRARMLRVYPGLVVCLAIVAFVVGPVVTTLSPAAYFADPGTYSYFAKSVTMLAGTFPLPGVFADNPYPQIVDLPIWTLKYEIACYLLLAALGGLGLFRRRALIWAIFLAALGAYIAILTLPQLAALPKTAYHLSRLVSTFFLGVLAWHYRDRIVLSLPILAAIAAVTLLLNGGPLGEPAFALFDAYGAMCFAALPLGRLRDWTNRADISYGLYIYGWTIEQILVQTMPGIGPLQTGLFALAIAIVVAWLSWTFIEKPALRLKRRAPRTDADTALPAAAE